jgi:preprotein translocase subunit Sec63
VYARPTYYTQEQLAAFTNHYVILGVSDKATEYDIKSAHRSLCKRFHPDMMRNVDSKEYQNNPDRPEFVKASTPSMKFAQQ